MLEFIRGTAQSGKTYTVIERVRKAAETCGDGIFVLVPEQYSFEYEKELLEKLGIMLANRVSVVSFTKLCRTVLTETGGLAARIADEGSRALMLTRAMEETSNDLRAYSGYADVSFARKLIKDINELKQASVTADKLLECADEAEKDSPTLAAKLHDLGTIISAYTELMKGKFTDPQDLTAMAAEKCAEEHWFRGKYLFTDGFTGFTAAQYELLEAAVRDAKETVFSFCTDEKPFDEEDYFDIFRNVKREMSILRSIAKKNGVEIKDDVCLSGSRAKGEGLAWAEATLRGETVGNDVPAPAVTVCKCENITDEAEYAALAARKAVRENGYRWRDIVIVSGTDEGYLRPVYDATRRNGVPCFISRNKPLMDMPVARFALSALTAVTKNYRSEDVTNYLKSGLSGLEDDEVTAIETYAYVWDINGRDWLSDWTKSPSGINGEPDKKADEERLSLLNEYRRKAIEPLTRLRLADGKTVEEWVKTLFGFMQSCKVSEKLESYAEELYGNGELETAALQSTAWDKFIGVLDRIVACMGDCRMDTAEFLDLLETAIAGESVGQIPSRADEAVYGAAERLRPMRPKMVCVIGANYGIFPSGVINSGIFTLGERSTLEKLGISLPDRYIAAVTEQNYAFYDTAASASEKIIITYSQTVAGGKPSLPVKALCENPGIHTDEFSLSHHDPERLETAAGALRFAASTTPLPSTASASVRKALTDLGGYDEKLARLGKRTEFPSLPKETAERLYGEDMYLSASRLETYFKCPFSYLCRYGLGLSAVKKAGIDSASRGTIAHFILENVLKKYKDAYEKLDKATAAKEAKEWGEEYFSLLGLEPSDLDPISAYTLKNIIECISDVIAFIASDFNNNSFKPDAFELSIGDDKNGIPAFAVRGKNCTVHICGKIDRVDICRDGDKAYIRVIDYKTMSKSFNLSHTLSGLNMQMLIYLCALLEQKKGTATPAGIIYTSALPGDDKNNDVSDDDKDGEDIFTPSQSAFILKDTRVLELMGGGPGSDYIPMRLNKDGSFHGSAKVATEEDFETVFNCIKRRIAEMGDGIRSGKIDVAPIDISGYDGCKYCDFAAVCDMTDDKKREGRISSRAGISNVLDAMREEETDNGTAI